MKPDTTFTARTSGTEKISKSPADQPHKPLRSVLVVDDEEYILTLMREVLSNLGYHPITASNGVQAMQLLAKSPFDLVITDIHMPGISGLDLLKHVKQKLPQLPVILISGFGVESSTRAARELNADGFLPKPFHIEDLRYFLQRLID